MNPAESSRLTRRFSLLNCVAIIAALYFAQDLFLPLVLAGLLCFLLAPLVAIFERWHLGRVGAVLVTTALAFSLIAAVAYLFTTQLLDLAGKLPNYKSNLLGKVASLKTSGHSPIERAAQTIEEVMEAFNKDGPPDSTAVASGRSGPVPKGDKNSTPDSTANASVAARKVDPVRVEVVRSPNDAFQSLRTVLLPVVSPLGSAAVVAILVVFMLLGREDLRDRFIHLIGRGRLRVTTEALDEAGTKVSRYLLAQLVVNVSYGVPIAAGLWFIGIPNAALWGLLCALLRFLPYVGAWIGAAFPIILSLAVSESWTQPIATLGLFIAVELISNNVVEPWLYGASTGLSPLAIVASAVFWTWLWGSIGLVLATPLTVCLAVAGKYLPDFAFLDLLLGDKPPIAPADRLYQRLLALDEEEAFEIVDERVRADSKAVAFDEIVLPALLNTEADSRAGLVPEPTRTACFQLLRRILTELGGAPETPDVESPAILCIPANHEADELAALMLAQILQERGIVAPVLSSKLLAAESVEQAVALAPPVICISSLPPVSVIAAAQLCKRLRARLPSARIVVGLWQPEDPDFSRRRERLENVGANEVFPDLQRAAVSLSQVAAVSPPESSEPSTS
jgi:predicted PurR-regulated permease PerM/methylmalonyl-CoA mutase cobalamin-binding subunit